MKKVIFSAIVIFNLAITPLPLYANQINFRGHIVEYTCDIANIKEQKKCAQKISKSETQMIESVVKNNSVTSQILMLTYH